METTIDLWSLFVGKLMKLLVHILLSQAIASVSMTILIQTSSVLIPSLDRVVPKYLNVVNSSSF
ncbi:hypothetical protein DPMN_069534 [Dreissena polymorpha]|uniref:Uncharacterized protein n=1 Tax=Dreissena polymorpha TaxID=45954 RepID=A0A9D3YZP4_DREPO|nr:hypothetical protein DPMN_069534 [Dreissena polymorpha]